MFQSTLLVFTIFLTLNVQGQLAIIKDTDGFVNVRESKSISSKVIGHLYANDIFLYSFDNEDDQWVGVFYTKLDKSYLQGYIHKSRLLPLHELEGVPAKSTNRIENQNEVTVHNDSIKVTIKTAGFVAKRHKIERQKEGYVVKIDGKYPKGIDGNIPKTELKDIKVTINGNKVIMPTDAYNDLFEPGIESFNVYFDKKGTVFLYMPFNSDGAGGYFVAWMIKNEKYVKRYVDSL